MLNLSLPNDGSIIDLGIDFETYYDDAYSLKKMENFEYVMDPRFEIIGVGLCYNGQKEWISGTLDEIRNILRDLPWERIRAVAHNARFDASIIEWRLGLRPHAYLCTMVGSRAHYVPQAGSASLHAVAAYLGIGTKGDYVGKVNGLHRHQFSVHQLSEYGEYCKQDAALCLGVAERLNKILPVPEQRLIDLTIKKYVRPVLTLDRAYLVARLGEIERENEQLAQVLGQSFRLTLDQIRSRTKFAALLSGELAKSGDSVPLKRSKPTKAKPYGGQTFAFAKDDLGFKALLGHANPFVRTLVQSKIKLASTLEESRIKRLIQMHDLLDGKLAAPLVYYGAHTGRFSGDEKINVQNLPRVDKDKTTGAIRKGHIRYAIRASTGYSIVAADFSNIEARIVATITRQTDLVEGFRRGEDIYSAFASKIFEYPVNKTDHPKERFVGKTCILGLGYGMGYKKFHLKMLQEGIAMSEVEAARIVRVYRDTYSNIPKFWRAVEAAAAKFITDPSGMYPVPAGMIFAHERIILPNGMPIMYPGLSRSGDGLAFRSRYGSNHLKPVSEGDRGVSPNGPFIQSQQNIWGGAFTENIAQALARIIATTAELKLADYGLIAALQVHDELVYHVPTILVPKVIPMIESVMTEVVEWLPELPVAVEIHHGPTYGDAK